MRWKGSRNFEAIGLKSFNFSSEETGNFEEKMKYNYFLLHLIVLQSYYIRNPKVR